MLYHALFCSHFLGPMTAEVMHLSAESQMDPDFAARIDLVQAWHQMAIKQSPSELVQMDPHGLDSCFCHKCAQMRNKKTYCWRMTDMT